MSLERNQERLRKWGFLTDSSGGYGPNTEAAYTLALDKLEQLFPLPLVQTDQEPDQSSQHGPMNVLTLRGAAEIISHEAIVLEMYKDSEGIPTWGVGVTSHSGHGVERYKDNPQTLEKVLEIFMWLVKTKYLPSVLDTFKGYNLTENQLAAALSFHWNTGSINTASWVKSFKTGKVSEARKQFMDWNKPASIIERRQKECNLFFDGKWSGNGTTTILPVYKPSYNPNWSGAKKVNILPDLQKVM